MKKNSLNEKRLQRLKEMSTAAGSKLSPRPNLPFRVPAPTGQVDPLQPLEPLPAQFPDARDKIRGMFSAQDPCRYAIDKGLTVARAFAAPSIQFRYHQVEQLLAQTASLLERGIASRTEWQSLFEKSFATWLELVEFADLDAIHAQEVTAGYYAFPNIDSAATQKSQGIITDAYAKAAKELNDELNDGELTLGALKIVQNAGIYLNPASKNDRIVAEAESALAGHSFRLVRSSYQIQSSQVTGQANAADFQTAAATENAKYDQADISFRRQRTEAARRIMALKLIAYTELNGALNYRERMLPILARLQADFADAMERIAALRVGLQHIYKYAFDLKQSETPFDDTLLAVRAAMEWLVRFSGQEQNYILPISLNALLKEGWRTGLYPTETGGIWSFPIDATLFPNQKHVRLRGLCATVVSDKPDAIFQAVIQVPQQASVTYLDNSTFEPLDQTGVPPVRIGRIQQLNSIRAPDVVGTLSLHNVSPICYGESRWRLAMTSAQIPPSLTGDPKRPPPDLANISEATARLKDVLLHLVLAVRTQ